MTGPTAALRVLTAEHQIAACAIDVFRVQATQVGLDVGGDGGVGPAVVRNRSLRRLGAPGQPIESAERSSSASTWTVCPSRISPLSRALARASPIAVCTRRRSGRAP